MKKIFLFLLITFLATAITHASPQPILTGISKGYSSNSIQLFCSFNSPPEYTINNKGKRIDLTLENAILADNLTLPEADDKIVKILTLTKDNSTTLSLFFRYPPQQVKAIPGEKGNELVLDILPGNEFTAMRPTLASQQQGVSAEQNETKDPSNPVNVSPYPGNWEKFFKEYEGELHIDPAIQFSLPSFPAISLLPPELEENITILPSEIIEGARSNLWNDLIPLIIDQLNHEKKPENKLKLTLTYGEILLRAGNFKEAYKQFYQLSTQHAVEPVGVLAKYLLARLQAEFADPYLADIALKDIEATTDKNNPVTPWLVFTQIEIALATKRFEDMRLLLDRDNISYSAKMVPLKARRQADYWLATGEFIKAHAGYQLLEKSGNLAEDSSSLNGYCSALYHHKHFKQAFNCYDQLAKHPSPTIQQHLAMISFRKAMAKLHITPEDNMINDFIQVEMIYPDTEGGIRAAIKQIDLKLSTLKNWEKPALTHYQALAETAISRSIREEAIFKEVLVYRLLGRKAESTELLMSFLKDYRTSPLHDTAQALLIETLPELLKEHIKNGKYIEALVLAKQNRPLFIKNWINISLLADMAEAYRQLGFFNEASKMYLYLLDVSPREDKAHYYLPLIRLAYEQGDSEMVEEYAGQYSSQYPKGQDQDEILYLRLQNLMAHNKYQEAFTLASGKSSKDPRFQFLQASLLFHLNEYAKAKALLDELKITAATKEPDHLFMLAESTYQLGDTQKAEELFLPLQDNAAHKDQAMFRLAEIARQNGQRERVLKLFTQIVETGDNPFWKKLAKKELEITALNK